MRSSRGLLVTWSLSGRREAGFLGKGLPMMRGIVPQL